MCREVREESVQLITLSSKTHLVLERIVRIQLASLLLVLGGAVQVLHVGGEHLRHPDAPEDAHDGGQHQHETHHHTLGEEGS